MQKTIARLCLLLTVVLAACTTPPAGPPPLVPAASLPPAWQHQGRHDYEKQNPGLGFSDKYQSPAGVIDVYSYDLQQPHWRAGVQDPAFDRHFQSTLDEVRYFVQRGVYTDLQQGKPRDVTLAGQVFRTVALRFSREGRPIESHTYLTAVDGRLLKYRLSFFLPAPFEPADHAREFVERSFAAARSQAAVPAR